MLRRVFRQLPPPLQRMIYKGGQRSDRLHDPDSVVAALGLRAGQRVADLGPGYGHFTLRLATAVAPEGVVYAADADQDTLDDLAHAAQERGITNIRWARIPRDRLELPEPVDLLFVSATYHHLRDPVSYLSEARTLLRPGGRVAILESRLEGLAARRINPHGSLPKKLHAEMIAAGYVLVEKRDDLVYGHLLTIYGRGPTTA